LAAVSVPLQRLRAPGAAQLMAQVLVLVWAVLLAF
jgi:hypothetical protein